MGITVGNVEFYAVFPILALIMKVLVKVNEESTTIFQQGV